MDTYTDKEMEIKIAIELVGILERNKTRHINTTQLHELPALNAIVCKNRRTGGVDHLIDSGYDISRHPIECSGGIFKQSVINHTPASLLQCDAMCSDLME